MSEVWNSVRVYGPPSEISRFKLLCFAPSRASDTHDDDGWDGCDCVITVPADERRDNGPPFSDYVWNFDHDDVPGDSRYAFNFDTDFRFPVDLFERIARAFPALAFDCDCIDSMDEFMGYGWFNTPAGGEDFSQSYDVPKDYWTSGSGHKRDPATQSQHEALIAQLVRADRETDGRL
ncbi:MAG: hypothetical protein DI632_00065 [Sphingomonas hengshuiensis]|uniref:YubB ferredoxin-like domain-containing protein n=1 Tax=Sphingomonas hengshuiensis TaxID=1609977 RepID=A0A2W4ZK16_9SPHN|nr:MAG: hypothetical protein DI632_00065 [Sphingomonas hengshuiensis]